MTHDEHEKYLADMERTEPDNSHDTLVALFYAGVILIVSGTLAMCTWSAFV
jgi:hypothetical protein